MCQICVSTVKTRGQQGAHKDKALTLSLLHSSPRTYRMLQDVFKLPSVKTLSRVMQKINVYPGLNENIMQVLRQKVALQSDQKRLCSGNGQNGHHIVHYVLYVYDCMDMTVLYMSVH